MLTHQLGRINLSGMIVMNFPAQYFPTLYCAEQCGNDQLLGLPRFDYKYYFDKVLADVPCSGDGATRKIPTKWADWRTTDAQVLHPLQIQILMRGISLAKVGGLILYSTCSINPIEDEAVVNAVFSTAPEGSLELLNVHEMLPGLIGRQGLESWQVFCSKFKKKEVPKELESSEKLSDLFHIYRCFE